MKEETNAMIQVRQLEVGFGGPEGMYDCRHALRGKPPDEMGAGH